ncbi:AAA family ATPase [bacterium]|nr:AAA family ATPase [bacterium]
MYENYRDIEQHYNKEKEQTNKILVLTGLSGCGKDFLLHELKKSGHIKENISVYSFGQKLFEAVKEKLQLNSRDQLRDVPDYKLVEGVNLALEQIIREQPVILNTHVVHKQGDIIACRPEFERKLVPASYTFVWTDPEQIVAWRHDDETRNRAAESVSKVALDQSIALIVTARLAKWNGSAFHTLENRTDNAAANVDLLSQYLEESGL